ncbi:MAG: beta-N-acetylhexosaminidase [Alphaproteobacteria bacterium]
MFNLSQSKAVILSVKGTALSEGERSFFASARPLGFILFARNCEAPAQVASLAAELREVVGWHCPVLIDQEGGRVQRLKPPVWRQYAPMKSFGKRAEQGDLDGALSDLRFSILQLAEELVEAGVDVNCAPVMDVLSAVTHDVIGDRAFSEEPDVVARMGESVCRNFLSAGVVPVIKHLPGHGRGAVDSHKDLPHVSENIDELIVADFEPFRSVSKIFGQAIWGMVAHIVYDAIDPAHPSSVSPTIIKDVIRGDIGFDGFLLSDDLDMEALAGYGDVGGRAAACLAAGCDAALYCAGELDVMEGLIKSVPNLSASAQKRLQNSYLPLKA